jgi:hypothetical protein
MTTAVGWEKPQSDDASRATSVPRHVKRVALSALALYGAFLWVFRPATPFEWDEVLALRGVLHYNVAAHAPQPPGIPAYIGAAKAVYWLVGDPLTALQIVGILAALVTLASVWALSRRLGATPLMAGAAAALVASSPGFAFMANVPSSDVTGTAVGVATVLALMAAVERPELLPLAGAVAGLAIGVRPQIAAVFAPALTWAVYRALRARRFGKVALAAGAGLLVAAACWVPAILATGPQRWWRSTTNQIRYMATVERSDHLPTAHLADLLQHWFVQALVGWEFAVPFWLLVVVGFVILLRTGRARLAGTAAMAAAAYLVSALFTMNLTVSLRYLLPAMPFVAILATGGLAVRATAVRRTFVALVCLWCVTALAWAYPAFRERLKPAPVWAALTWVRQNFDPAHTRVIYHGMATPHVQYVLGRNGFRIVQLGKAPVFEGSERPGEQTLFVTPRPVPGAELLFEAHQRTQRVVQLAWGRYGSCAVSRLQTSTKAVFSPEWQVERGGWQLAGTGHIHLPVGSKPALVRVCAGRETLTLKRPGAGVEPIKPRGCVTVPLMPGPAGELAVTAPAGSATLVPPVQILPLAALEATDRLASSYMIPMVARTPGHAGAFWRTDVVVINPQKHPLRVTAQFLPAGTDNDQAPTVGDTLAPGQILDVPDVLTLQPFEGLARVGAMLVHATDPSGPCTGARCNFLVLSRTYNSSASPGEWRAVEWLPGVAPADTIRRGDRAVFSRVSNNAAVRTSVGVASWSAERVRVRVRILTGDGTVLQSLELEVPSFGQLHIPLGTQVTDGRIEVDLLGPGERGMVVPYVSAVENTSGLPAHLLPERIPGPAAEGKAPPPMPEPLTSE